MKLEGNPYDSGDAHVAADTERITNRDPARRGLPPGLGLPALLSSVLWVALALLWLANPYPEFRWLGWGYVALAFFYSLVAWSVSISWIEISPSTLRVGLASRSLVSSMSDVVDIEAHRHWQSPFAKGKIPLYWLKIRRTSGWPWRLQYIEPAAGDRILATLHRLNKPILVYNWQ